ncbi:hypothetical protein [Micromonospora sp. NPDC023888]|uniref:hypothetical protein n=1 Tax=Micromonospora sp. NPDC023888 TaxID=3155607 RepID=UPI00340B7416
MTKSAFHLKKCSIAELPQCRRTSRTSDLIFGALTDASWRAMLAQLSQTRPLWEGWLSH